MRLPSIALVAIWALPLIGACESEHAPPASARTSVADSAFVALQQRGAEPRAMGVDQYTSVHLFDALPDGGRVELQRAVDDSAGMAQIRA